MTKSELLANIRRDRAQLDALIASLPRERMAERSLEGGRSVQDVLAHITAWEQLCLDWIRTGDRPGTPFTMEAIDAFNAQTYEENRGRALAEVLAESRRSSDELLETVEQLSEEDLTESDRFAWTRGEPLSLLVSANADDHYREHIAQIEAWLGPR